MGRITRYSDIKINATANVTHAITSAVSRLIIAIFISAPIPVSDDHNSDITATRQANPNPDTIGGNKLDNKCG